MFWDKGFTPSHNIEALLQKENVTLEEFLDDEDILQECKSMKKSIVDYITRPDVIKRLVELIITEPPTDLPMAERFRHANMACEILTIGLPSLDEKLMSDGETLKLLYSYLENEPPLNPLLSSFFSKTIIMLFTKKSEQDWFLYQKMCLQLLEYFKLQNNFLDLICKHFETPIIPELVMQMLRDVEGGKLKRNLYEWLNGERIVERLIGILGNPDEGDKHANVAEFLCDLIKQGRMLRQSDEEHDSFEPAFDGSNPILRTIEDEKSIESLLNVILDPSAPESAIVSGISVVLILVKPSLFNEDSYSDRMKLICNREKEIHEQIVATVIRVIMPRLKQFHTLLQNPPKNVEEVLTTAGRIAPPFGLTRLEVCRVFTVLLQTNNEDIAKAICATEFFETLLVLFKQYCWNNFLHSELEKCVQFIFLTQMASNNNNNSTQSSTVVNDGSFNAGSGDSGSADSGSSEVGYATSSDGSSACTGDSPSSSSVSSASTSASSADSSNNSDSGQAASSAAATGAAQSAEDKDGPEVAEDAVTKLAEPKAEMDLDSPLKIVGDATKKGDGAGSPLNVEGVTVGDSNVDMEVDENEANKENIMVACKAEVAAAAAAVTSSDGQTVAPPANTNSAPSFLQAHVIKQCKLISKLIDCWQHNTEMQSAERGRRLGYMGHLIKIFKHITRCISEYEHIGALVEASLQESDEWEAWQAIVNPTDGEFTKALATQSQMLANCNAHESSSFAHNMTKDFLNDNTWDFLMSSNVMNHLEVFDSNTNDIVYELARELYSNGLHDNGTDGGLHPDGQMPPILDTEHPTYDYANDNIDHDTYLFQFDRNFNDDDDDDEDATPSTVFMSNPWDNVDPFGVMGGSPAGNGASGSGARDTSTMEAAFNGDSFADFDVHFSAFREALGDFLQPRPDTQRKRKHYDNENSDDDEDTVTEITTGGGDDTVAAAADGDNDDEAGDDSTKSYDKNANVDKLTTAAATANDGDEETGKPAAAAITTNATSTNVTTEGIPIPARGAANTQTVGAADPSGLNFKIYQDEDDENSKNEKIMSSIWRSLHTVMQDSEDDYEDDEGMWTKPFSASSTQADEADPKQEQPQEALANAVGSDQLPGELANGDATPLEVSTETTDPLATPTDKTPPAVAEDSVKTTLVDGDSKLSNEADKTGNPLASRPAEIIPSTPT